MGDGATDAGIEFARVAFPVLASVVFEEHLIEARAYLREDDFFGVLGAGDVMTPFLKRLRHDGWGSLFPYQFFKSVEIDGKWPVVIVGPAENLVVDRVPLGELTKVVDDIVAVGAEVVRAVFVDEEAGAVIVVVGVACDVVTAINDKAGLA